MPGQGSTFTLFLPVARPDFAEQPAEATPSAARGDGADRPGGRQERPAIQPPAQTRRLLVVEERPRGLLSLVAESVLSDLANRDVGGAHGPVEIVTAAGAPAAAATLAADPCHCIVLDLDMPGRAAFGLLDAIDGDAALRGVPVLAYNNWRMDPEQEQSLQERADSQPLELLSSLDELRERIALHLTADQPGDVLPLVRSERAGEPAGRESDGTLAGRTVLVVDDDTRNLFALTSVLEMRGMRVLHAEDGRKGIDTLLAHPEIDIVLMDVMMPEMDGYAATSAIRAMPQYANLPIIAVTAKAMPGDQEKSLAAGSSDYVTKPVETDHLLRLIQRWISA